MSLWLYIPVTIHLENIHHKETSDRIPKYIALGGIFMLNAYTDSYYIISLNSVPYPEKYTIKMTCPLLISATTIEWIPLTLIETKYLKEESSSTPKLNPFIEGITSNDQFKFRPFNKNYISILSMKFSSLIDKSKIPLFNKSLLLPINFEFNDINIPSKIAIQCCPFSLTNVAIFANYKLFGSINYCINNGVGYLSDIRYLDNTIGGIVNLDNGKDQIAVNSIGLVGGNLSKVNGDGELLLIISWKKIFELLPQNNELLAKNQFLLTNDQGESEDPINSCVRISVSTSEGQFWGSGIILLENTIITNLHVLKLNKILNVEVLFPNNPNLRLDISDFEFKESPLIGFDLCFMVLKKELNIKLSNTVKFLNNFYNPLKTGQKIKSIGYGLIYTKHINQLKPFHSEGFINSVVSMNLDKSSNSKEISLLLVSASCWNGSSGGGLFNESNELIGIMTSNGKLSTGEILPNFTLAIPINIIEKSLFMLNNNLDSINLNNEVQDLWSLKNTHGNVIFSHINDHKL